MDKDKDNGDLMEKMKEKLSGKTKIILILGLIGIGLIFISNFFTTGNNTPLQADTAEFSLEKYIADTEQRLSQIVSSITGEKEPQVMVTAESTIKKIYAVENRTSDKKSGEEHESEETYVMGKGSGGSQNPIKLTEEQPVIKGVVVVSVYGDNYIVKEKIIDAVKTSMGLSSGKVCVVSKYKGQ